VAHYWLCSDKQKKMEATDVATKCLPKKCEHLRLKNKEGERCGENGALQTQL